MGVCDYTDSRGFVTSPNAAQQAVEDFESGDSDLTREQVQLLVRSASEGTPIPQCSPSQSGVSPLVIGLGVLGVGAAIALSQRND